MSSGIDVIYKKKDVVGIDIGSTTIKAVQLRKKGNLVKLVGYGVIITPKGALENGVIVDPKKISEVISKLIKEPKMGKFTAERVASSLPETKIFTRIIKLPNMPHKEIEEAVKWEIDQYIPTPSKELNFDWKNLESTDSKGEKTQEIMIVAAPKKIVDSYLELFKDLNLELFSLEMSLGSITRAMVSNKNKDEIILIVDIGGDSTNIAIFDHSLRVSGSIPIGGNNFVQSLSAVSGKDEKISKDLIRKCDIKDKENCKTILASIDKDLEPIAEEVKKLIKYYLGKKDDKAKIERLLVSGGCATVAGLADTLGEKVSLKAEIGNPWANISIYPLKPIPKKEAAKYTNAVGLALKGIIDE